nr:Arc family DNA binding domain-containing protein [uncultured Sediminibacterium sp.]
MSKKSFVLRMDEQAYAALEKWAADEFRSVNGQIEMLLDKALKEAGRKKEPCGPSGKQKIKK